jgi:hypothetical protein
MNKYDVLGVVGEGAYGVVLKCKNKDPLIPLTHVTHGLEPTASPVAVEGFGCSFQPEKWRFPKS